VASHLPLALEMLDSVPVDLILTNVGRAPGGELDLSRIHLLRHRNPEAKMVVFTGHPQARRLDFDGLGIAAVLMKPADLEQLCAAITNALD